MTLAVILLGLIALIVVALAGFAVWQGWRRREDGRPLRSFRACVRAAHAAMGVSDPYSIPRILATGSPAAIDALCRSWRLTPAGEPGWYGRVWNDAEGLLIAEPNDMLSAPPADRQLGAWRRLLRAVLRNRPGRPLDAILWVVAADALVTEDGQPRATPAAALESSRKLFALQRQFGQMLPLYVVISGCDAIAGFDALAAGLGSAAGSAPLGWASPYPPKRAYDEAWIGEAFATLRNALTETIAELGTLNGGVGEGLFLLPQRIDALRTPLRERIDLALRGGADGTAPLLRGIHCVGSVPERPPADDAGGLLRLRAITPAFAARLWHDVVLRGQGLALPIPRVLALRMRKHRVATIAAAALGVCWCVGLGASWWHLRSDARTLAGAYDSLTLALTTYRESDKSDAAAAKVLGTAAGTMMNVPRWRLTSLFMPLSFTLSGDLDDAQEHLLRSVVFAPLRDRLTQRLADLSCGAAAASGADAVQGAAAKPQDLPEYLAGTRLVADAAQTEHLIARYNELVQAGAGNLAMLAQLMHEAVGVTLAPEHVADRARLDAAVRDTAVDDGMIQFGSAQAVAARQRASLCFEQSFDAWFDRVYSDSTLTANAAQVQTALTDLRAPGATPADAALTALASGIDTLAAQVDTADHGWASAHGKELVPGLTTTFDQAQHLRLIGGAPVEAVLAHEEAEQNAFSARWLVSGNLPGVLSASPATGLQLAADLPPLREALRTLLAQPFAGGSDNAGAAVRSVDAASAQRALAVLPAYRQYVAGQLAQAPDAYRSALLAAAGNDAVQSMVSALSAPASPAAQRDGASVADAAQNFDALKKSAVDLIAAFDSLGRDDLATAVALRVSDAALAVLRAADAQLQSLAPFRPARGDFSDWNGNPGGALRAFGAATPQALQTYLAAQSAAVADAAGAAAGALDWLSAQKPPLEPADARLVSRWKALSADLAQYRAKSPASAMIAVPAIISGQLDKLDLDNCSATLEQIDVPATGDIVASAGVRLVSSAREQCFRLQMGTGMEAYEQIRNFFARYLAGHFPFAADANAPAADVRQTAAFVALLDAHLADAQRGLAAAAAVGRGRPDEARFAAQLAAAKPWLDALLARGADGTLQGMELAVDWRVDRADEVGADQVIEWKLASGSDTLTYPSSGEPPVRWKPGLPVSVSLRWAKDAPWQPMFDAAQPTLAGEHGVATWSAADTWALLRIARLHQMQADAGTGVAAQPPRLLFTVPVRDRNGAIQTARMYLSVGFINAAKTPQAIPDLPAAAPGYDARGTTTLGYPPAGGFSEAGRG
ncbi:type VI secretion system protein [Trinickia mobilis]|uniref:type VI secretion system protein n=1 Tax=Trinickia mobilis TaxID=2816356 RepID=UPI001A8DEDE2|nr:type VI secretion system protein [Trinickia mobilis]